MPERYARKVLILGATGPTGLLTLRKALDHNHLVTVYARNPSKIPSDISDSGKVKASSLFLDVSTLLTTSPYRLFAEN
jgi:nucleoside-diphosphate-sugar epimerase